jgi:transcriptional regulator with XRE-family HTH domain
MDTLGKIVNEKRIKRGETLKQLARALKCSEAFARHIESSPIVPISPRLIGGLRKHYRLPLSTLEKAAKNRNRVGTEYYRKYKSKRRKAA